MIKKILSLFFSEFYLVDIFIFLEKIYFFLVLCPFKTCLQITLSIRLWNRYWFQIISQSNLVVLIFNQTLLSTIVGLINLIKFF